MIEFVNENTSDKLSERELEEHYRDMLDENLPELGILGMYYTVGTALKELDPIAFRECFLQYADAEGWTEK